VNGLSKAFSLLKVHVEESMKNERKKERMKESDFDVRDGESSYRRGFSLSLVDGNGRRGLNGGGCPRESRVSDGDSDLIEEVVGSSLSRSDSRTSLESLDLLLENLDQLLGLLGTLLKRLKIHFQCIQVQKNSFRNVCDFFFFF